MTPICYCKVPDVMRETRETTSGPYAGQKYDVTYCRKCGHHWSPKHGSNPAPSSDEAHGG